MADQTGPLTCPDCTYTTDDIDAMVEHRVATHPRPAPAKKATPTDRPKGEQPTAPATSQGAWSSGRKAELSAAAIVLCLLIVGGYMMLSGNDDNDTTTTEPAEPLDDCGQAGAQAAAGDDFDLDACPSFTAFRIAHNRASSDSADRDQMVALLGPLCPRSAEHQLCQDYNRIFNRPTTTTTTRPPRTTTTTTTTTLPEGPAGAYIQDIPASQRTTVSHGMLILIGNELCDEWRNLPEWPDQPKSAHQVMQEHLEGRNRTLVEPAATHLCPEFAPVLADVQAGNIAPPPPATTFGSGTYTVGIEIAPGTYQTGSVRNCYWARLDADGQIIDNNFISGAPQARVTIRGSDFGFTTDGCGTWEQVG